jgi:hypothetical protein
MPTYRASSPATTAVAQALPPGQSLKGLAGPDGKVPRDRLLGAVRERFDAQDKGRSGALTVEEVRALLRGLAAE